VGTFVAFLSVIMSRRLVLLMHFMRPLDGYGRKCDTGSLTLLTATSAARLTLRNLKKLCRQEEFKKALRTGQGYRQTLPSCSNE
jgi:hypothetical protein